MKKYRLTALFFLTALTLSACSPDAQNPVSQDPPDSYQTAKGGETEILIHPGEWQLPGTLTLPDGEGPFPLVVFVHGSGPSDRDETMGKQKLFRDLASDLAQYGIASIRYDKRTYIYANKMQSKTNLTVKEETIDDALQAVCFAQTTDRVDPNRVYIAGHSMGGYLIPRIDQADTGNQVAGYISLAGSVRSIMELTIIQIDYILSLDTSMSEAEKDAYKAPYLKADQAIKALTEKDRGSSTAIMGAYPTYWLDLADYRPDAEVSSISEPLLFLQGEHDYQVTMTDFDMWKTALGDNPQASFVSYPNLSHSFVETPAMGTPDDYNTAARVDKKVAQDIRDFILG